MTAEFSLGVKHLVDVKHELGPVSQWKMLGRNLGLSSKDLEMIKYNRRLVKDRVEAVLVQWLKRNYDFDEHGLPSWGRLAEAVRPFNLALALTIIKRHPSSFQSELHVPKAKVQC